MRNMKKILSMGCLLATITFFLDTPVSAMTRNEMNIEFRDRLDTYFSNFTEVLLEPFSYDCISNSELIRFGIGHNLRNRRDTRQNYDLSHWAMAVEDVDDAVYKYFGKHIEAVSTNEYQLIDDEFLIPKATGEGVRFAQVTSFDANEDGTYTAVITEFLSGPDAPDDPHAANPGPYVSIGKTWRAVVEPSENGNYWLKEYLSIHP